MTQILLNRQRKIVSRMFLKHPSLTGKKKNLIHNTTLDTKACIFQYKVLPCILYANKMLFKFGKVAFPRGSFCWKLQVETIIHGFYDCLIFKRIWNELKYILSNNLIFQISTPQSAIFRYKLTPYLKPLTTYWVLSDHFFWYITC